LFVFITQSSQEIEPPTNPGRFREYKYSAYNIDADSYSSSRLHPADDTKEMSYSHFMPTEASEYFMTVKIEKVPSGYENIKARIELHSGWK